MKFHVISKTVFFTGLGLVLAGISLLALGIQGVTLATPLQQAEPFEDTACLDCHTDQQRLTELAATKEEEHTESLSSGPG